MTIRTGFRFGGLTLTRNVMVLGSLADDVTVEHERVHQRQMRELGLFGALRFHWRWLFNKVWRLRYEAEAFVVNMRAWERAGWSRSQVVTSHALNYRRQYDGDIPLITVEREFAAAAERADG